MLRFLCMKLSYRILFFTLYIHGLSQIYLGFKAKSKKMKVCETDDIDVNIKKKRVCSASATTMILCLGYKTHNPIRHHLSFFAHAWLFLHSLPLYLLFYLLL